MSRVITNIAAAIAVLAVLIGIGFATGLVKIYNGQNSGILIANTVGYEWRGTVGFFHCDGQC